MQLESQKAVVAVSGNAARGSRRSEHEIDLTGTMRAVYGIEEQARLEEQLVKALEQLRDPTFPGAVGEAATLESEMRVALGTVFVGIDVDRRREVGRSRV